MLTVSPVERHYSVDEIAGLWSLDVGTIRKLFLREPGVLVIDNSGSGKRSYRTIRIPHSVLERVHSRRTNR